MLFSTGTLRKWGFFKLEDARRMLEPYTKAKARIETINQFGAYVSPRVQLVGRKPWPENLEAMKELEQHASALAWS